MQIIQIQEIKILPSRLESIPAPMIMFAVSSTTSCTNLLATSTDEVLRKGIQGISDLIATPSMINLDFADVKNIIKGPCSAHLGVSFLNQTNIFEIKSYQLPLFDFSFLINAGICALSF